MLGVQFVFLFDLHMSEMFLLTKTSQLSCSLYSSILIFLKIYNLFAKNLYIYSSKLKESLEYT